MATPMADLTDSGTSAPVRSRPVMTREDGGELELRDYIQVLKRRKWTIAAATVLVTATAVAASLSQTKVYEATAEVLLQSRTSERIFSPDAQQPTGINGVATEIQVMKSRLVQDAVTRSLGRAAEVSISAIGDTNVVSIRAEDVVPTEAARVANAYAAVYIEQRREGRVADLLDAAAQVQDKIAEIDTRLAEILAAEQIDPALAAERQTLLTQRTGYAQQLSQLELAGNLTESGGAQLITEAETPTTPVRPTPRRSGALALAVGLMLGVGFAFLRDYLDDSLRTKEDLEKATDLGVLAIIPAVAGWKRDGPPNIVTLSEPTSAPAESYRSLRTSLQFLSLDRPMETIQVTSAAPGDGKTTTVANLAVSLARAGQRVVVLDADLRRPRIHQFFGVNNGVGLTSVLIGEVPLNEAIQRVPGESRLALLASGPLPPNPSELLSSKRTASLLTSLRESADVVIIDSPPVLPVTDASILAGLVDATVVVATSGRATRRGVHRAVESLRLVGAPIVGAVLNAVRADGGAGYGDGYGYGYSYSAAQKPDHTRVGRLVRRSRERAPARQ